MTPIDCYRDHKGMHSLEGDRGLRHLNQMAEDLGYSADGFKFGSSLEKFLSDNPGAMDAIAAWAGDQFEDEFREIVEEIEAEDEDEFESEEEDEDEDEDEE